MPVGIFEFLIMTLAVARLTRVVTDDSISIPFRHWVEEKESDERGYTNILSFTTLLNCHWCTGWWVAFIVAGSTWAWGNGNWIWWIWTALSASYVVGMMEDKLGSDQ